MQVIRLARVGRNKYPTYRIVTADKRRAANGKFMTILGHYNPHTKELLIKREELKTAIEHGAQPSNTVLKLMLKDGIELPKWATVKTRKKVSKQPVEEKVEEPKAEAAKTDDDAAKPAEPTETTDSTVEVATEQAKAAEAKELPEEASETPAEAEKAAKTDETTEKVADVVIAEATKEKEAKE